MNNAFAFITKTGMFAVLAAAVISCNNQGTSPSAASTSGDSTQANTEKIVYVNADTLLEKYEYFKDIRARLEEKAKKTQADLQSRSTAFQRDVADYQQKAATMSAAERQSTEERLARKQDELARHNQNASSSFAQEEAEELLFRSYFTDGKNIDDYATLIQLGTEIGLDANALKTTLENGSYADAVRADIMEAQQLGVRGVPFFVMNRKYAVSGAQESKSFLEMLEKSFAEWQRENPGAMLEVMDGKTCTPDGKCD